MRGRLSWRDRKDRLPLVSSPGTTLEFHWNLEEPLVYVTRVFLTSMNDILRESIDILSYCINSSSINNEKEIIITNQLILYSSM